jgi:hypothetical protein
VSVDIIEEVSVDIMLVDVSVLVIVPAPLSVVIVVFVLSVVDELEPSLLQAVKIPAIAKTAINFFIVLLFF